MKISKISSVFTPSLGTKCFQLSIEPLSVQQNVLRKLFIFIAPHSFPAPSVMYMIGGNYFIADDGYMSPDIGL